MYVELKPDRLGKTTYGAPTGLRWARAGAVLYGLWGLLHIVAALRAWQVVNAALEPGVGLARAQQSAVLLAGVAIAAIWIALARNWHNDRFGHWFNLYQVSVADLAFIGLVLVPGYAPLWPGLIGPLVWLLAASLCTVARVRARRSPSAP